jgi:pimeloyl-ACP methyl ester carboxylesterase
VAFGSVALVVGSLVAAPPASADSVDWARCEEPTLRKAGIECTRVVVPLDRDDPAGATVSLAVARHRSTGTDEDRIGILVFNPGGPGGSGLGAIAGVWGALPDAVRERFDLVTWDPRGLGESTPRLAGCRTPMVTRPTTGPVDWAQVARDYRATLASANRRCQERNADIIAHLGTNEVVADLDAIRAALGEEQITYWGLSYGTRIGYVYALRYPERLRALMLDGSIDPAATYLSVSQGGAGPDQAYGTFADAYPDADRMLDEVLAELQVRTVPIGEGARLTRWDVLDTVYGLIGQQGQYATIAKAAQAWHDAVFGEGDAQVEGQRIARVLEDAMRQMGNSNAGGVFSVVNCSDYPQRPTLAQATAAIRYQDRLAPRYGGSLSTMFALGCSGLSFEADPIPVVTGEGSDVPALILGSTRDAATVVQWTTRMSRAFPASRTVTYAGGQHVTWLLAGSECVNRVGTRYLLTTRLPVSDRGCPNAYRPE